jgi:site-specific DNA-methyltransferase (adenine-specific)
MEDIKLIHGDSLQALKGYADNHFDIAIVDPPYGINRDGHNGVKAKKAEHNWKKYDFKGWDNERPTKQYWKELFRVSKKQVVFGANYFSEYLPPSMGWIVWDKGQRLTMSDGELIFTSENKALRIHTINRCEAREEGMIHPTQKPTKIYKIILEKLTNEGDLILDTHLGSGSIAIAAHYMKRKLIGYEIDKEYYDAACKRFKEQTMQQALW